MTFDSFGPAPGVADPHERLERQRRRFDELRIRAEGAQARLAGNSATASEPDGAVTVTVNAGGQLTDLRLGAKADGKSSAKLAEAILRTYRRACAEAAARTIDIMSDLSGEDSLTVAGLKSSLPAEVAGAVEDIRREEGRTS